MAERMHRPLVLTDAEPGSSLTSRPQAAVGPSATVFDLTDPQLREFLLYGDVTASGAIVNVHEAMKNTAVWRAVSLISFAIGMLPLQLLNQKTKEKADDHPVYKLLHREPNNWQTAFDFRTLMQFRVLAKGNAYALIIRSRGQIIRLVPLDPDRVTPVQNADWSVSYRYTPQTGSPVMYAPTDIFHLRGMSFDGISGISLVHQAREAIGLALQAERAVARVFRNGSFIDGVLQTDKTLSDPTFDRLKKSWEDRFAGANEAGKTAILEDGLKYQAIAQTAKDAQTLETRKIQIEEVARVFGVPRPLLMVDETSWGSGIEALGQFFVTHALQPWFTAWEQAIERTMLAGAEKDTLAAKFNAAALLRGSLTDQATFFSNALGSGGHQPWMKPSEVRDMLDLPESPGIDDQPASNAAPPVQPPAGAGATSNNTGEPDARSRLRVV